MPEKTDNIELRSEKVRNIIGQIPSRIVRSGISVLFVVVMVLLTGSYFFHYPDTAQGIARLSAKSDTTFQYHAQITLPYRFISKIQLQQKATIELEGYAANDFGVLKGEIIQIFPAPTEINGQSCFIAKVALSKGMTTTQNKTIPYYANLKGNAKIVTGEHRLLEKLLSPIVAIFSTK